MKSIIILLFLLSSLFAQNPSKDSVFKKIVPNSLIALESDVNGLVESSIYQVIKLKQYFPSADYSEIENSIVNLTKEGKTSSIRVKANIALIYLNSFDLFSELELNNYDNPDEDFKQILNKVDFLTLANN